jgi:thiamine pyrophosphate-dependent acetolactate synthase large subunit-like protein
VDFAGIARACGWTSVFRYRELSEWRKAAAHALATPGPVFIALDVTPVTGAIGPKSPGPTVERARRFTEALRA